MTSVRHICTTGMVGVDVGRSEAKWRDALILDERAMICCRRLFLALFSGFLPIPVNGVSQTQPVPSMQLGPPSAQLTTQFTRIVSISELADGRILIADHLERSVVVADFTSDVVSPVGRIGQGPEEFTNVTAIMPLARDSSLMADLQTRRWLVLHGATIVRTVPLNAPALLSTAGHVLGVDGNGFLLSRKWPRLEDQIGAADSVILIRVAASSGVVDTVAKLGPSATRTAVQRDGSGQPRRIEFTFPILGVDEQALLFLDGWLAIARLRPYRVDWRSPAGAWIDGPPLPFREIPVNDREKQAYRERRIALGLGAPSDRATWPTTVPAFLPSFWYQPHAALVAAPDGKLLIARTPTADRVESSYDMVDRSGKLVAQVVLLVNERIAAIGSRGVYVVATDEFGLERVRRHPWPLR